MILDWMGNELWCGQAENGGNSDLSWIWNWMSRSIASQNNRDLNQGLLPLWSKFDDPSLNGSWVLTWPTDWHTHTQTHTVTRDDNTWRPKLASGKNETCMQGIKHIIPKMFQIVPYVITDLSWKFHETLFIYFTVMLLSYMPPSGWETVHYWPQKFGELPWRSCLSEW